MNPRTSAYSYWESITATLHFTALRSGSDQPATVIRFA